MTIAERVAGDVERFDRALSEWVEEAVDAFDFRDGRQWPEEDARVLREQNRPVVVYNRVLKFINSVVGTEIQNGMAVKYYPAEPRDTGAVDLLNLVGGVIVGQDVDEQSTEAFRDCVTCGMGWTEEFIDYTDAFEGKIRSRRVDPFEMGWDHRAQSQDLEDARFIFRRRRYSEEEIDERWPGASKKIGAGSVGRDPAARRSSGGYDNARSGAVFADDDAPYEVVHYQWKTVEAVMVVDDPATGRTVTMDRERFKKVSESGIVLAAAEHRKSVYRQVYVCGTVVLEEEAEIPGYTYKAMTGQRDRNKGYWFGMVRVAKDPQMWANKFLANVMHIISSAGKGVFVETDAIPLDQQRTFETDYAKPNRIKWLEPGGIGKIKQVDPQPMPPGLADMLSFAVASVNDTIGLSAEFMGLTGQAQAGVVEESRKGAAVAILADFFKSRRLHIKNVGRLRLAYMVKYLPDKVFVRVGGEGIVPYLKAVREIDFENADIRVDQAPTSPDQKGKVWAMLTQIAPSLGNIPPQLLDVLLRYSPLPESVATEMAKALSQPNPQAQMMAQLETALKKAEVDETTSKAVLNTAKAYAEQQQGQPDVAQIAQSMASLKKTEMDAEAERARHGYKMTEMTAKAIVDMQRQKDRMDGRDSRRSSE